MNLGNQVGAASGALGVPVLAGLAHRPTNGRSLFVNIGSRAPKSLHEPGRDGAEAPPGEPQAVRSSTAGEGSIPYSKIQSIWSTAKPMDDQESLLH